MVADIRRHLDKADQVALRPKFAGGSRWGLIDIVRRHVIAAGLCCGRGTELTIASASTHIGSLGKIRGVYTGFQTSVVRWSREPWSRESLIHRRLGGTRSLRRREPWIRETMVHRRRGGTRSLVEHSRLCI